MYLTKRQKQILDAVKRFIERNGYSPSIQEIGEMMGLTSPATVHKHLENLQSKGVIKRRRHMGRALELTEHASAKPPKILPMLGMVAAGAPIEAIEDPETVEVPRQLVGSRENFVLRVKGDSMIDEGIHDGDLIIVEKRESARPGQTVVALVEGDQATVKFFFPEGRDKIRLQPANSTMKPMVYPADQVKIQGIVVGLMRKYR